MKKDDIIKYAVVGRQPETALTCPERSLYFTLKDIYEQYRKGNLTKSQGEALKNAAVRQFDLDNGAFDSAMKILRENAQLWKAIEQAGNQYRLERTLENADAFIEAVYQVKMKKGSDNDS